MKKLDIPQIARNINEKAHPYDVGELQSIRTKLKKFARRPGTAIFSNQTTFAEWAFHHGGRSELQYNIGFDGSGGNELRHGVAFSLELNQTLQTIDPLVPKINLFNDFFASNTEAFGDMRLWYWADGKRSEDTPPRQIPDHLVRPKVFIFLGKRQSAGAIDYDHILRDFDRLLPLYRYVESGGVEEPLPVSIGTKFAFKPGCTVKRASATTTLTNKQLDLDLRHNELQLALFKRLVEEHGKDNVGTELPSGVSTRVDAVVRKGTEYWFYEIKTALTARACLREALGQLLEYAYWPGAQEPSRLIIVGQGELRKDGREYLALLRERFHLPIAYEQLKL